MLKVTMPTGTRLRIPKATEIAAASAVAVAHEIVGWLLIVFAILIVAVAGPRRRSRVFAVLFATVIVIVVLTGCADPAAAASPQTRETGGDATQWLTAAALGAGAVGLGFGVVMVTAALRMLSEAIVALFFGLRVALFAATLLGGVIALLVLSV